MTAGGPGADRPRILLAGNHSCGNRGDAAILRGLIAAIETLRPDAELVVTSRYPTSSAYLLGRPVAPDAMEGWVKEPGVRLPGPLRRFFQRKLVPTIMAAAADRRRLAALLPAAVRRRIAGLRQYELVVQVGGSFFVDLYGNRQFETPFGALLADRPLLLIGHSVGPFGAGLHRLLARRLLAGARVVALRESVSREWIAAARLPTATVRDGSDTAWLVPPSPPEGKVRARLDALRGDRPAIAITLRDLAPFDRRLGVTQAQYETAFARLCDGLIARGYDIVAASTCTGIEQYRDDRMVALRVADRLARRDHFRVVMDELNDVELGQLLGGCVLLVGTRLHSAIIAMNFGTPAFAINYEHKSEGIMAQLGLPMLSASLPMLLDGQLQARVDAALDDLPGLRARVAESVARERRRAFAMVRDALGRGEASADADNLETAPQKVAALFEDGAGRPA